MATVNIGNLAFTHKGDYASGTAYVKNDVVYYSTNGNAYIAKQGTTGNAPTNATYWNQFAQGSGGIWNAGLSLGSASQKLRVNSGGSALEFFTEPTVTSDFVKLIEVNQSSAVAAVELQSFISSTYKNYKVIVNNVTCNTSGNMTMMRMMTGTNTQYTAGNYYNIGDGYYKQYSGGSGSTQDQYANLGGDSMRFTPGFNNGTDWASSYHFDMYAEANKSIQITGIASTPRHGQQYYYAGSFATFIDVNNQNWTGLYIYMSGADNITSMDVTVYGLKD